MNEIDDLLDVTRDALLEGRTADAERVASELARALGAAGAGVDEHGLWLGVVVGSAELRMRWIGPGSVTARGRRVRLTTGRWFAEQAVTRALYAALMDVPLQGPPDAAQVGVSWSGARQLCRRLAVAVPALRPRLPSAVEWAWALQSGAPGVVVPSGAVREWCEDAVSDDGETFPDQDTDPLGDRGVNRALMGVREGRATWSQVWGRRPGAAIRVAGGPALVRGPPPARIAAALGVASDARFLPHDEVVAWVDGQIANSEHPDPLLIDASMGDRSGTAAALVGLGLRRGIHPASPEVGRRVLGEWLHAHEIGREVLDPEAPFFAPLSSYDELVDGEGVPLQGVAEGDLVRWLREVGT